MSHMAPRKAHLPPPTLSKTTERPDPARPRRPRHEGLETDYGNFHKHATL